MEVKADDPERAAGRGRSLGTAALIALLVAPGVLTWLWSRPRPAVPTEMPALALGPAEVAEQRRRDEARAGEAPSGPLAEARLAAYREANEAELLANDSPGRARARRDRLVAALAALVEEHGEEARDAVRAADLARAMTALRGEGGDRDAELGSFVDALARYGMVRDGRQVAPSFIVRTTFKARWNAAHGRPLTEGMSEVERRAHWGWLGLEVSSAPVDQRLEALDRYAEAGGARTDEARGILLLSAGRHDEAAAAFDAAYDARPTFRLRNHALAARLE